MGEAPGIAACLVYWAGFILLFMKEETGAANRVQCLNNYGFQGRRVDCQWYPNQALGETSLYLNFSDSLRLSSDLICPLLASPGTLEHFSCSAYSNEGEFTENDEYSVILHTTSFGEYRTDLIFAKYQPRMHIECDPPFDLQSQCSAHKCQIQWKTPKAYEEIFENWQWELAFKATQEPWEQAERRILVMKETRVDIEGTEFKSGRDYVARMRCKTPDANKQYRSQWSPWSSPTAWKAPQGTWQQFDSHLPWTAPIYCVFCLGALLLLLALALKISKRARSSCRGSSIPTPAAFFQPLYLTHQGNFKGWIGVPERRVWLCGNGEEEATPPMIISQLSCLRASLQRKIPATAPWPNSGNSWSEEPPLLPGNTAQKITGDVPREPERPSCAPSDYCTLEGGGEGEPGCVPLELLPGSSAERMPSAIRKGWASGAPGSMGKA